MERSRLSKKSESNKRPVLAVIALLLAAIFIFLFLSVNVIRYGSVATKVLFDKKISLKKDDERINILLLGIGGGKHQGPNLSDTIIFASVDPENNKVTLISIPRDFWIPELDAKINTAYAYGQKEKKGIALAKKVVSDIVGQQVDYGIRVDFSGFVKAVDIVDGIDVNVERTFDDFEYPIPGEEENPCDNKEEDLEKLATAESQLEVFPCRYEHLHFDAGLTHMDGETALKLVRSRHAEGEEGTDFARSKRQEKVLAAFKDKIFSIGTFLNPVKIISLLSVFEGSIDTDITEEEIDDFIKLAQKLKEAEIQSFILDAGDDRQNRDGLLINPRISQEFRNQWVLIPRTGTGNYTEIQRYIECQLNSGNCEVTDSGINNINDQPDN